jgi:hypothetical protein
MQYRQVEDLKQEAESLSSTNCCTHPLSHILLLLVLFFLPLRLSWSLLSLLLLCLLLLHLLLLLSFLLLLLPLLLLSSVPLPHPQVPVVIL